MAKRALAEIVAEIERLQQTDERNRDRQSLLHEISVYHEELVVQNDALVRAQTALEETRDRFVELYDFAPVGYLTLNRQAVIEQCNLTAAAIIGRPKPAIEGYPLQGFVAREDRERFAGFVRRCRQPRINELEL